jgi:PhnB protein
MKSVTTYLHFNGNCREAMTFYQRSLGTDIQITPVMDSQGTPSTDASARVMHSQLLRNGQTVLQASDDQSGASPKLGDNFQIAIECESVEEIDRLFAALNQGGKVRLPLGDVPWGARFGMLTDKFGIQWLLNCYLPK